MRKLLEYLVSSRVLWLFAVAATLVLSVAALWWGGLNQDEGWYLYAAQLVNEGKLPYHDFFFTQGPTMPVVYSVLSPIWTSFQSPLHGLLGGRVITLVFGLAATAVAAAVVRRLVKPEARGAGALMTFALLACNLYHLYFTSIPKTYALGSLFVMTGFLYLALAVGPNAIRSAALRVFALLLSGVSFAFASGTRISLVLILGVVGFSLLFAFRRLRWSFLWFGLGGVFGLALTYGAFALDPVSLKGLLAAQSYHAARGGFDPFFALGSVSRLVRAYLGIVVALVAAFALFVRDGGKADSSDVSCRFMLITIALSFLAVVGLQLSAPFPYDDYQVPVMGLLAILASVLVINRLDTANGALKARIAAAFVFCVVCAASFGSPLLQQWFIAGQDRFWSIRKDCSDLAGLRRAAVALDVIDPDGTMLLTQDLYLAVESGRRVPAGFEMGPFSYFPALKPTEAADIHVLSTEALEHAIEKGGCTAAALSGYAFAISAPTTAEIPFAEQKRLHELVKKHYALADTQENFGQNQTTLLLLKRK